MVVRQLFLTAIDRNQFDPIAVKKIANASGQAWRQKKKNIFFKVVNINFFIDNFLL